VNGAEREVLTRALLRVKAQAESPETPDRERPGLRVACRILQGLIRGDEEKPLAPTGLNRVHLEVEVDFGGTYYEPGEMTGICKEWIEGALEDRQDVKGVAMQGIVRTRARGEEE
jgi:hypothetical protein